MTMRPTREAPPPGRRNRPDAANIGAASDRAGNHKSTTTVAQAVDMLADLDAVAEHLRGRFVVQVVVDAPKGHRRTFVYRNCAAAERAVERAKERGQTAHVTLVQMLPVGVVAGVRACS